MFCSGFGNYSVFKVYILCPVLRLPTTCFTCFKLRIQCWHQVDRMSQCLTQLLTCHPEVSTVSEHRIAKLAISSRAFKCKHWKDLFVSPFPDHCCILLSTRLTINILLLFIPHKSFIFCEIFFPYLALLCSLPGSFLSLPHNSTFQLKNWLSWCHLEGKSGF